MPAAQVGPEQPAAVQPAAVQPAAVQPGAVKPAAVRQRPARAKAARHVREIKPGDRICGNCGEGNDPTRNFCRRCGASLADAEVFHISWWGRVRRWFRRRRLHAAGDRPKVRRRLIGGRSQRGILTTLLTFLLVAAVIAFAILVNVGPYKSTIRHRFAQWYRDIAGEVNQKYSPVHPVGASATASAPGGPPVYAIDGATNTCWQASGPNNGVGQTLELRLASPTTLARIGFLNGDQDTSSTYLTQPRAQTLHLTFVATGTGTRITTKNVTLSDTPSFQTFSIDAKDTSDVYITIDSVYPSVSGQGHNTSIAEVELFKKS